MHEIYGQMEDSGYHIKEEPDFWTFQTQLEKKVLYNERSSSTKQSAFQNNLVEAAITNEYWFA
jgi:hypothetical protein